MLGALLGAGAAIAGGLIGSSAQSQANRTNLRIAREQMQFQEGQTAKQMEFQERMSSTAHQREIADLKAAGVNPLLAVSKGAGGASTPAGASAPGALTRVEPVNAFQSALGVLRQLKELQVLEQDRILKREQTTETNAKAQLANSQANRIQGLFDAELAKALADAQISDVEAQRLRKLLPLVVQEQNARINATNASARDTAAAAGLKEMELKIYGPMLNSAGRVLGPAIRLFGKKAGGLTINNFPKR